MAARPSSLRVRLVGFVIAPTAPDEHEPILVAALNLCAGRENPSTVGIRFFVYTAGVTTYTDPKRVCAFEHSSAFISLADIAYLAGHLERGAKLKHTIPLLDNDSGFDMDKMHSLFETIQSALKGTEYKLGSVPGIRGSIEFTHAELDLGPFRFDDEIHETPIDDAAIATWTNQIMYGEILIAHVPEDNNLRRASFLRGRALRRYIEPLVEDLGRLNMGYWASGGFKVPLPAMFLACRTPFCLPEAPFLSNLLSVVLASWLCPEFGSTGSQAAKEARLVAHWDLILSYERDELDLKRTEELLYPLLALTAWFLTLFATSRPYDNDHVYTRDGRKYKTSYTESFADVGVYGGRTRTKRVGGDCDDVAVKINEAVQALTARKFDKSRYPGLWVLQQIVALFYCAGLCTAGVANGKASSDARSSEEAESLACHAVLVLFPREMLRSLVARGADLIRVSDGTLGVPHQLDLDTTHLSQARYPKLARLFPPLTLEGTTQRSPFFWFSEDNTAVMHMMSGHQTTVSKALDLMPRLVAWGAWHWIPMYKHKKGVFVDPFYKAITQVQIRPEDLADATYASGKITRPCCFFSGDTVTITPVGLRTGLLFEDLASEWARRRTGTVEHDGDSPHALLLHYILDEDEEKLVSRVLDEDTDPRRLGAPVPPAIAVSQKFSTKPTEHVDVDAAANELTRLALTPYKSEYRAEVLAALQLADRLRDLCLRRARTGLSHDTDYHAEADRLKAAERYEHPCVCLVPVDIWGAELESELVTVLRTVHAIVVRVGLVFYDNCGLPDLELRFSLDDTSDQTR
jgi:hypothetical protein